MYSSFDAYTQLKIITSEVVTPHEQNWDECNPLNIYLFCIVIEMNLIPFFRVCTNISSPKGILIVNKMSEPAKIKLAILVLLGALFAPIAAQAGSPTTVTSAGTVTLNLQQCDNNGTNTSVQAASVILLTDTASAIANVETSTYVDFGETDTALWGADYNYGQSQDANTCAYTAMNGTVTLSRGRFISSYLPATMSETNTNTTDFIQYIGNLESGGSYTGLACGALQQAHAASVTTSCTTSILSAYSQLTYSTPVQVRTSSVKVGVLGQATGKIYTFVKVKKSAIVGAPTGTTWVATETYTVTSS